MEQRERILSIDYFRSITVFVMIFVNDIAGVKDIPSWLKHMPGDQNGMTFVDVVFPAFLFIVGMSIPVAFEKRELQNKLSFRKHFHIISRSLGLILLGLFMVNFHSLDTNYIPFSKNLYKLLFFISAIVLWSSFDNFNKNYLQINKYLKIGALLVIIYLAVIFRGSENGNIIWMRTYWWGILGLIGLSYFLASVIYIYSKGNLTILSALVSLCIFTYIGDEFKLFSVIQPVRNILWIGGHLCSHTAIILLGIILTKLIIFDNIATPIRTKIKISLYYSLILFIAGLLLYPLYGINKNMATPTWVLFCSAICIIVFLILFIICDYKKILSKRSIFLYFGVNPLLAYLLPDVFYSILGIFDIRSYSEIFGFGYIGLLRSFILSIFILFLTKYLTKAGLKLKL